MTTEEGQTTYVKDEDKWVQEDNRALEIIQNSLSQILSWRHTYIVKPPKRYRKEIWESLEAVYGTISNLGRVFKVKRAISDLKQEEDEEEFNKHLGKFRCLWSDLNVLRPMF